VRWEERGRERRRKGERRDKKGREGREEIRNLVRKKGKGRK
jgi:hypothetical protein